MRTVHQQEYKAAGLCKVSNYCFTRDTSNVLLVVTLFMNSNDF